MSIKFICSCGKHLKARDEMARRRSVCPRCGQPVGIPSGEPTHPGTAAAPLTPAERLRLAARRGAARAAESGTATPPQRRSAPPASAPRDRVGALMLALVTGRRAPGSRGGERALETRWHHYLVYPFHDWRVWVGPALLLAALAAAALLVGPRLFAEPPDDLAARWAVRLSGALVLFVVVGYPCNFLGGVLRSAAGGDGSAGRWAGHTFAGGVTAAALWLGCFLAGPVVPAAVAAAYWMQCGDPGLVDWLILAELGILAVGYLLLVLAAVSERGRLRDANPLHVIDLAHRLGFRAAAAALAGSALALAHGLLGMVAAEGLHRGPAGALLLAACCFSGMFWATVLFRLLGVWCHRSRAAEKENASSVGRQ